MELDESMKYTFLQFDPGNAASSSACADLLIHYVSPFLALAQRHVAVNRMLRDRFVCVDGCAITFV
jgi:hypothetical protein